MLMSLNRPSDLPAPLRPLVTLAYNLRWSWHSPTRRLFEQADSALWAAVGHNPVRLLADLPADRLAELAADAPYVAAVETARADLERYLSGEDAWFRRERREDADLSVAYFSAEFAITECLPIASGGLGVLAGDHLKSASDLGVPLVAVGLFYGEGYFTQRVDRTGWQYDSYTPTDPADVPLVLERRPDGARVLVTMPFLDHTLTAQVWRAEIGRVPLYLMDTDIPENIPEDRRITDRLYGGDAEHRIRQEIVLGIGGMRALRALGRDPRVIHLNEGHAAFAAIERVRQAVEATPADFREAAERMADGVVFTTHTPVPAGHDFFTPALMERYLGGYAWEMREPWDRFLSLGRRTPNDPAEHFCMTTLALRMAGRRNGVSKLHGEVSRSMWQELWPEVDEKDVPIGHITNGVHLPTWVSDDVADLYARWLGEEWRDEIDELRWQRAAHIPLAELWDVRRSRKMALVTEVRRRLREQALRRGEDPTWTEDALDPELLTVVFARRFATYKRASLLLTDPARLERLLRAGRIQFVFAGKAHPRDEPGKEMLRQIFTFAARPEFRTRFVFLEGYDVELSRALVSGADIWLNVPRRPHEASGTSGMKAAANGVLNMSILDGWWAEAWSEHNRLPDPIGWAVEGRPHHPDGQDRADAEALYALLEVDALPTYYDRNGDDLPARWLARARAAMRQLAPEYSTHRMVRDYTDQMYIPANQDVRAFRAGADSAAAAG
jgi:starch phosphorylase